MQASSVSRLVGCALALALLAAPASARPRRDPDATPLKTVFLTKPPPDFAFDGSDGPRHLRDFVGRPVIVNFWASYCEPCRDELDAFTKIAPAYGSSVGLVTVDDETPGNARAFLAAHGYALPLVEDPQRAIFGLYAVVPIPVTVVVGSSGAVSKVIVGEMGWDELRADIDAELAPPTPAHS